MVKTALYSLLVLTLTGGLLYLLLSKKEYASDKPTLTHGQQLFAKYCVSCHSLGNDGIGPRLGGITNLLSKMELTDFIGNPAKHIESGEQRSLALQSRYKQIMPSFEMLNESDINSILSYIHQQSKLDHLTPLTLDDISSSGLKGRLVKPVQKSALRIELEDIVRIPRIKEGSPDLGIATLRPHPSGDGTLFANDQNGFIYRIRNRKAEIFLDVRAHVKDFQSGPGIATGIGSFDFHPDFLSNGLLYITHAETYKGQTADYTISDSVKAEVQWVLSEWKMDNVKDNVFKGTRRELLRLHAPTFGHGCQDIGFIPGLDKKDPNYALLYFGFGDGGSNNIKHPELGHHLKSFLGSIMRIDPAGNNSRNGKYGIPADNPFADEKDPTTVKEIYAFGFRNPHRLAWDSMNGNRLIATDIGESNIEEINIVVNGGDYGWPGQEGNFGIATKKDLKTVFRLTEQELALYKRPFAQYDHEEGNAISGGYVYEGNLTLLKGKYVFGDIVNGKLFYVNIDRALSDSTIYQLSIVKDGKETNLKEISGVKRLHLRIGYDRFSKDLYVITKADGWIRRVMKVTSL